MRRLPPLLCALLVCAACSEPPQKEIDRAQGAIDAARAAGAERYAQPEYTAATSALQQAHDAVQQRDYRVALSRALDASERAQAAAKQAADGKARARGDAEKALATTATALQQLRSALKRAEQARVPASQLARARAIERRVEGGLQEARAHLGSEQYLDAAARLDGAPQQIQEQMAALDTAISSRAVRRRR